MEFILASGNQHKAEEFSTLFNEKILKISAASKKIEVIEDGKTFNANALKKAEAYYKEFKTPVVSDDSGLCVMSLPDELGIHTARYGGDGLSDKERAELLIREMKNAEDRSAYFVCVLCFYLSPEEIYFFEGRVMGDVSTDYRGDKGFGYDPVFVPEALDGETLAENPVWKEENSHRAKACQQAQKFFTSRQK